MKKLLSIALAAALAVGMGAISFAASYKAGDQVNPLAGGGTIDMETLHPYSEPEYKIDLTYGLFSGDLPTGKAAGDKMTAADLRNSKLTVRTKVAEGTKAIKSVDIDTSNSQVRVKWADELVGVGEVKFDFIVYLSVDNKRRDNLGVTFVGTLENELTEVHADDDYIDLSEGQVAEAEEFVPKVEVDLGNGVSVFTKLFKGKKYYGTASRVVDESDDVVLTKYPDVDNIITLKTVGLNSTGDIVKLGVDYSDYYVYDAGMQYLGQATDMLPFSAKYYLANQKLDVAGADNADDTDDESIYDDEDTSVDGESGGEEGEYPEDVYDPTANPNTGATGFLSAAIAAAVLSLAVVAITRKGNR